MNHPHKAAPGNGAPDGLFLAIDTSGVEGSVAIGRRSGISDRQPETRLEILAVTTLRADEEHASLLLPRVQELLGEVGAGVGDLSGVVVGAGPGSFTGVRVGAATAKGLAWALDLPLWAFSSLAAAAADVEDDTAPPSRRPLRCQGGSGLCRGLPGLPRLHGNSPGPSGDHGGGASGGTPSAWGTSDGGWRRQASGAPPRIRDHRSSAAGWAAQRQRTTAPAHPGRRGGPSGRLGSVGAGLSQGIGC